jgi:hypothetical protein
MSKKLFAVMLVVGFVAALLVSPVLAADETITGTVVQSGDQVSIKTDSGDIMVGKEGKGAELMNMVNKKVEVTGAVQESEGKKTINVTDYKVME